MPASLLHPLEQLGIDSKLRWTERKRKKPSKSGGNKESLCARNYKRKMTKKRILKPSKTILKGRLNSERMVNDM